MGNFAPLHIYSGYSFLQSGLTIEKIESSIKANSYFALGLSDYNALFGVAHFANMAKKLNKPYIIGMTFEIGEDSLVTYVKNEQGYKNLIKINLLIQDEKLSFEKLEEFKEGLILVVETKYSFFVNEENDWVKSALKYFNLFEDDFYLGIDICSREDMSLAKNVRDFAEKYDYQTVAFPRIKYQKREDAIVLKIVNAIDNDNHLQEKTCIGQECFLKEEEYQKIYNQTEINNTIKIVNKSSFVFEQKRGKILSFGKEAPQILKDKCYSSLKAKGLDNNQDYLLRLEKELDVIISMGFVDIFLLVQDYISFAKTHNILVAPGRGSAAGSLVSYLLNITEFDPLKFDLQFERFLNPNRKNMPDIDTDFMDIKRDDVIQYMRDKYGEERVANIVAFQTIQAKQAIRDIGRVYNIPSHHLDLLSKTLTNRNYGLRDSYRHLPAFRKLVDSDEYFLNIIKLASQIEGLPRQAGMHAAGVILSEEPLSEVIPVTHDFLGHYTSQYSMEYLEDQGLLKMDFLALRNLTTVSLCVDLINEHYPDLHMKKDEIPYDDKEAYKVICSQKTMGIFQLESSGMKAAIKTLKPSCFNDIVALLALFRPGPMKSISTYAKRKNGEEQVSYIDQSLKDILSPTYGIIVYQEQINQIATKMAGFSLGDADLFRRAISKKDKEKIESSKESFINGSIKNGIKKDIAIKVFDNILRFADYGFNKSHSVAYSMLAMRMAYLKARYPLEFYSALLATSSSTKDSKFVEYVSEMKSMGYKILVPDINKSTDSFIIQDGNLLFPLSEIKGINSKLVDNILKEREKGLFEDYFNFTMRMYQYKISEKEVIALINAGTFDKLHESRATLLANVKAAMQYGELNYFEDGQMSLGISIISKPRMLEAHDDPLENLFNENQVLGIMLSDNPLHYKHDILIAKNVTDIISCLNEIEEDKNDNNDEKVGFNYQASYTFAGIIKSKKVITTKKGSPMAFVKFFDETQEMEMTVFSDLYSQCLTLLETNAEILVKGHFNKHNDEVSFIADQITNLED